MKVELSLQFQVLINSNLENAKRSYTDLLEAGRQKEDFYPRKERVDISFIKIDVKLIL